MIFLNKVKKIKVGLFKKKSERSHEPIPRPKASVLAHFNVFFFFLLGCMDGASSFQPIFFLANDGIRPFIWDNRRPVVSISSFGLLKNWGWDFSTLKIYFQYLFYFKILINYLMSSNNSKIGL